VTTVAALVLSLIVSLGGQRAAADAVRDAESRRLRALVSADYQALDLLLADELSYGHSTAKVDSKASYLEPLKSGPTRYTSLQPEDVQVRVYGATAVLTGTMRSVAMVAGQESRTHLRFTSVWIERDARWQMAAWQSTRVPVE